MEENSSFISDTIDTGGGPLIVLPSALLPDWFGSWEPPTPRHAEFRFNKPTDPATDYDRACDVEENLGEISVGAGVGLVLGDELTETYVVLTKEQHVIIVRPVLGDANTIEQAILHSSGNDVKERIDLYVPYSPEHLMFDSAFPGRDLQESLSIKSVRFIIGNLVTSYNDLTLK